MQTEITTHDICDVLCLRGGLTINSLPSLTPVISSYLEKHDGRSLVFDLSQVSSIDSSIIRLILNIHKRLETANSKLYLLSPVEGVSEVFKTVNLDKALHLFSSKGDLRRDINLNFYNKFLPFTYKQDDRSRLRLSCEVCGSSEVIGYLLNENDFRWKWIENNYFPQCVNKEGKPFDYFSSLPIVCTNCFMTSTDITDFNVLDEKFNVKYRSALDENSKLMLSKNIKKRKIMMEKLEIAVGDKFFLYPRNNCSSLQTYILAESCSRIPASKNAGENYFKTGLMNFFALKYAQENCKEELISSCRTWFTQALNSGTKYSRTQMAQIYYILLISCLKMDKQKEVDKIYSDFSTMMKTLSCTDRETDGLSSPHFWFTKAQAVWNQEIETKSQVLQI